MRYRRYLIPLVLAGGLVMAACGHDGTPDDGVGQSFYELTVIDAVQLGAAQGCHGLASIVEGSLTIKVLEDSDGLVLLQEDGYPLCIDTLDNVAAELEKIEASYKSETEGTMSTDDVEQMMMGADEMPGSRPDDKRKTDPNPQPAGPQPATSAVISPTGEIQTPEDPSDPSDSSSTPEPPPESND